MHAVSVHFCIFSSAGALDIVYSDQHISTQPGVLGPGSWAHCLVVLFACLVGLCVCLVVCLFWLLDGFIAGSETNTQQSNMMKELFLNATQYC